MLKNYYKIAIRSLWKYKFYSIINIVGLAIGITAFLFIFLYIQDELSYDQYHKNAQQIVRVDFHAKLGDNESITAQNTAPAGPTFMQEYPEVESFFRFRQRGSFLIKYEDKHFKEENIVYADSSFFQFFSVPLVHGNSKTALTAPNSIVLSEPMAKKYFANESALGKTLILDNKKNFKVTGVMESIPSNTHFHYDFLMSMNTLEESRSDNWGGINFNTYFLLAEGTELSNFENKIQLTLKKYFEPVLQQYVSVTWDEFIKGGNYAVLKVMPLTDIHLHSDKGEEASPNSDIRYIYVFGYIALFILIIAGINFVNLTTARSVNRAKEVGVRKVVGAMRKHLVNQFLSESILIAILSLILAWGLLFLLLASFNDLSGKEFMTNKFFEPSFISISIGLALITGLLSGIYPAFILSAFRPINILKGNTLGKTNKSFFRNSLVVFQFFVTTLLIIGTLVVFQQLEYMQNKKLGYKKENVIIVDDAYALGDNIQAFKQKVQSNPSVISSSISGFLPTPSSRNTNSYFKGKTVAKGNAILVNNWTVDFDYIKTMGMEIIQGRDFDKKISTDSTAIVINEELARQLGHQDPIGKIISGYTAENSDDLEQFKVIGVVKDFHFSSLREHILPLAFFIGSSKGAYSIRVNTSNIKGFINQLEMDWKDMAVGQPFSYQFMDDQFSKVFKTEARLGKIIGFFSFLAIFIACIGLLGIATFIAQQRTKEIGIRKVLGANIPNLVFLLSKDFGQLILIAFLLAVPVSWYFMNQWLEDFAYATSIGIGVFITAGVLIVIITSLSIIYQSTRVALINPIDTLKVE